MNAVTPTREEWRRLYDVAVRFRKMAPWAWMDEAEVFGVQNPDGGQVGYCSVLGGLGELYALVVYLGEKGLNGFLRILSQTVSPEEALYIQDCLMASFVGSKDLEPQDRTVIKELGLKFRGASAWPEFKSHRPGFLPWHLNREEALFLTEVIEQACIVCETARTDEGFFQSIPKGSFPVRVPIAHDDALQWETRYLKPALTHRAPTIPEDLGAVDELTLQRIKKKPVRLGTAWEIDYFFAPIPVAEEGERPYFPGVVMVLDHQTGMILATELHSPGEWGQTMQQSLQTLMIATEMLPAQFIVNKNEVKELLKMSFPHLPTKVKMLKRLPAVEEARASLFEFWKPR